MTKPNSGAVTRTLTIVLPESEWHALRTVEPDAIQWLRGQIRERLGSPQTAQAFDTPPASVEPRWNTDEY